MFVGLLAENGKNAQTPKPPYSLTPSPQTPQPPISLTLTGTFEFLDYAIFMGYALLILGVGLWVSRDKKGHEKNAEDYFLASKSLPWWAVGTSLIAANISAEQFIGMSGSGFSVGLAIASYEWMAALTLIIVGKYFLPIFIEKGIYTIPGFVEKRYSTNLKTILAVFWIALYVFVNLASVSHSGQFSLETIMGIPLDVRGHRFGRIRSCLLPVRWAFSRFLDGCHPSILLDHWRFGHDLFGA